MNPISGNNTKNLLLTLAVIVVLVLVALVFTGRKQPSPPSGVNTKNNQNKTADQPSVVKENAQTILSAFPAGFPVEAGAQNTASFKYLPAKSTEQQSTLEYISKKTLAQNAKIFTDYFTANSFKVTNKLEKPDLVFYYAVKDANVLSVTIKNANGQVTVSASYLKR